MTPGADGERFGNAFGTMCELFEKQSSPLIVKTYFSILKNFNIEQVEKAIWEAMSGCKFFPKPVELIELICGKDLPPENGDEAENQINEILKQIRQVGSYGTPVFEDPITKELLSTRWTFRSLCSMTNSELVWWRKEFADAYKSMCRSKKQLPAVPSEPGKLDLNPIIRNLSKFREGKEHDREDQKKRLEQSAAYSCVPQ